MKPSDLLDPETLPEDLHWLVSEFQLNRNDPVFLLIAWHWHRVKGGEDSIRTAIVDLEASLDARTKVIAAAAETSAQLQRTLASVERLLSVQPLQLAARLQSDLEAPVGATVQRITSLEGSLGDLLRAATTILARAERKHAWLTFLLGVVTGSLATALLS